MPSYPPCCCRCRACTTLSPTDYEWGKSPQRINGGYDHEPTPFCTGVGCKLAVHDHPGLVVKSLEEGHELGEAGLKRLFPVGSEWYYGPNYENMETRVRVTEGPRHSGGGKALLRDHKRPGNPPTWFVGCEVVSSPFHKPGYKTGYPPATLIPATVVERERGISPCCTCAELEQKLAQAEQQIKNLRAAWSELEDMVQRERKARQSAQATLLRVRDAIA